MTGRTQSLAQNLPVSGKQGKLQFWTPDGQCNLQFKRVPVQEDSGPRAQVSGGGIYCPVTSLGNRWDVEKQRPPSALAVSPAPEPVHGLEVRRESAPSRARVGMRLGFRSP